MLSLGLPRKVTVYLNEDSSSKENSTCEQVLPFLSEQELAGATLIRPEQSLGSCHYRTGVTRRYLPIRIEFIDSPSIVETILPSLCSLISDGIVEVQETTVVKTAMQAGSV